jgi:hypothetical protein
LEFEEYHNQKHRYSANKSKTPFEQREFLGENIKLKQQYSLPDKIPLEDGEVIIIRFIRSDRNLNVFGETFLVKEELIYSYVEAFIVIASHKLIVKRDDVIEHIFEYQMTAIE